MAGAQDPDTTIARTARAQHGVVSRDQLLSAGLPSSAVAYRVRAGRLERLRTGVYAIGGSPPTWERSARAACFWAGPKALVSHRSAGRVWGVLPAASHPLEITVPHGTRTGAGDEHVVVHRTRSLTSADRAVVRDLPVTTIGRTLVDLAAVLDLETLAVAVDDALCRRLVAPGLLQGVLDRLSGHGRRHTAAVRTLLEPWVGGRRLDSVAEGVFRRRIAGAGLPPPVAQFEVHDGKGFRARLDFAWPGHRVALEVDGFRWHANPQAFARDAERANRLAALGWTVLRATPAQIGARPGGVLEAVRRQLATACRRAG